jgi:hypothetical protein
MRIELAQKQQRFRNDAVLRIEALPAASSGTLANRIAQ